jgi:hypothetical protein
MIDKMNLYERIDGKTIAKIDERLNERLDDNVDFNYSSMISNNVSYRVGIVIYTQVIRVCTPWIEL